MGDKGIQRRFAKNPAKTPCTLRGTRECLHVVFAQSQDSFRWKWGMIIRFIAHQTPKLKSVTEVTVLGRIPKVPTNFQTLLPVAREIHNIPTCSEKFEQNLLIFVGCNWMKGYFPKTIPKPYRKNLKNRCFKSSTDDLWPLKLPSLIPWQAWKGGHQPPPYHTLALMRNVGAGSWRIESSEMFLGCLVFWWAQKNTWWIPIPLQMPGKWLCRHLKEV